MLEILWQLVCEDLKRNDKKVEMVCVSDRNYLRFARGYCGRKVVGPQEMIEMYRRKEIDKILVCSIFHVNEIINEFLCQGIDLDDIVSISTAIFSE